jgi:hypothetical protein
MTDPKPCGCVPDYYDCDSCTAKLHAEIRAKQTPRERAYDSWAESQRTPPRFTFTLAGGDSGGDPTLAELEKEKSE